jgi:Zn-dependent protease
MGLFIEYLNANPTFYFTVVVTVIISVTLHELAHGWTAMWYGDNTPAEMDRLTPNPLVHMGIMSIIFVFIAGLGWGAMPVNPSRMRGKYADAIVSLAGPAMNLLLAGAAILAWGLWSRFDQASAGNPDSFATTVFYFLRIVAIWNIALAVFNLVPIPPLDGSRILADLVPAYRDWAFQPTMLGIWNAVFIALFFFAGRVLWPFAYNTTELLVTFVRGYQTV